MVFDRPIGVPLENTALVVMEKTGNKLNCLSKKASLVVNCSAYKNGQFLHLERIFVAYTGNKRKVAHTGIEKFPIILEQL